jgi:hypothetical protein
MTKTAIFVVALVVLGSIVYVSVHGAAAFGLPLVVLGWLWPYVVAGFLLWLAYFVISEAVAKGVAEGIRKSDIGTTIRSAILQARMFSKDEEDEDEDE